jgi:phosphohistidine phosphatase
MGLEHLILLRHAKSSWSESGMADHERPLNQRGRRAAKAIGGVVRVKGLLPTVIWSSDSVRTRETVANLDFGLDSRLDPNLDSSLDLKRDEAGYEVKYLPEFYHASAQKILYLCAQKGEPSTGPLMLVGHNPGFEDLLFHFSNMSLRMPTAGCALFRRRKESTDTDWLTPKSWKLAEFIRPKDLSRDL